MKLKILIVSFLLITAFSNAQDEFQILEQDLPFHKLATSFTTNFIGLNENFVLYNWQKFIEKHKGSTYVVFTGEGDIELESDHVVCPFLNGEEVIINSRIAPNDTETGVDLRIWIQKEDGTYYSTKTDKDSGKHIKNWLLQFHQELMQRSHEH